MTAFTDYARNGAGDVVHRSNCRTLNGYGFAWLLVEGMTPAQLAEALKQWPWIRPCKTCRPTGDS